VNVDGLKEPITRAVEHGDALSRSTTCSARQTTNGATQANAVTPPLSSRALHKMLERVAFEN
jgi:hypothetical protein